MARWTCARFRFRNAIAAILSVMGMAAFAQEARVDFINGVFTLVGWQDKVGDEPPAAGWDSVLAVYAAGADTPMLGKYSVENGPQGKTLRFQPRFPLSAGVSYRAVFPGGSLFLDAAAPPPPAARVEHIYPSAGVLPANELKLYIYFSAPMSRGEAWQHIHLLDDSGKPVPLAFLELEQELWDPGYQRLTVLFDPGRIKRGLVPTNEIGSPIVEGKRYKLVIDRDWHDARRVPLLEGFQKTFTGGPADRTPPDPRRWIVTAPKAGTVEPLTVEFPKPMDYALLQRMLDVPGVDGRMTVDRNETRWSFTPNSPWKTGTYHLVAENLLEDIAGNHLDRAFDVDSQQASQQVTAAAATVTLPFHVR
jgi:hypothetical protein